MMTQLFAALRGSPLVQPVTLDQFFDQVSKEQQNGFDRERQLAPSVPAPTPISLSEYEQTENELDSYRQEVGATAPSW